MTCSWQQRRAGGGGGARVWLAKPLIAQMMPPQQGHSLIPWGHTESWQASKGDPSGMYHRC